MEPVANPSVVEGELRRALNSSRSVPGNSVLLLRAAPEWRGDATFTMEVDAGQVTVTVAKCPTVLAVLDAIGTSRDDGGYLVVLTPCETRDVGESVLARAMQPEIKPINRWDLVQDAFGARRLDPALTRSENRWLAEALLDAQPAGGWRRLAGPVLTRATALNRLAATRLGIRDADDSAVDAAALLEWTTDASAVASFLQLREAERVGLVDWLERSVGRVANVVFAMEGPGKVPDAVPFGLAIAALYEGTDEPAAQPHGDALVARVRAAERYLGGRSLEVPVLQAFGLAAESLVVRWTDNGHAPQAAALCERAESILSQLGDGQPGTLGLVGSSRVLEAGLDARLAAFAGALADAATTPQAATLARVQDALRLVGEHARKRDRGTEISAAQAAVRLARWLAAPDEPMATLDDAATSMLRSWAWADRALTTISRADTSRVPRLAEAYAILWDRARARRARLDQTFARKLATWTESSSATDGLLLVENLMDRIARPLAPQRPPVVVVLDGMTAAIGCELVEELTGRGGWLEVGRRPDGREPALATVPSVTSISRTSLLTGGLRIGGQVEERAGFAAFWGRRKSRLFHKADLTPGPGQALAAEVRDAIADPETAVGVVLNVIDDTLDKSKPGGPAHWTVETVTYLRPVLDEARRGGRPVILTADHGHVLEWGHSLDAGQSVGSAHSDSARYRIGQPGAGEIAIRGPRVLTAGAEVVAAVDETIRYTPRKAGYHGGASPAEVVIPAITLLPSESLLPPDWFGYDAAGHAPAWWDPPASVGHPIPADITQSARADGPVRGGGPRRSGRPTAAPDDNGALFGVAEAAGLAPAASGVERATGHGASSAVATSLGTRVVGSPRMAVQRQFLRRVPDDARIAVLIDGLAQSGGRLTITEAASMAGESPVRMSGYLAQVTRLLNVDGYAVLQTTDGGRTVELNVPLLRQQFLGD
jgi:PglZ domain